MTYAPKKISWKRKVTFTSIQSRNMLSAFQVILKIPRRPVETSRGCRLLPI